MKEVTRFNSTKLLPITKEQVDKVLEGNNLVTLNSVSYNEDFIISPPIMDKLKGSTVEVFVLPSTLMNSWGAFFLKGKVTYAGHYFKVIAEHSCGIEQEMSIRCILPNYHYYWDDVDTFVIASKYTDNESGEFFVYVLKIVG